MTIAPSDIPLARPLALLASAGRPWHRVTQHLQHRISLLLAMIVLTIVVMQVISQQSAWEVRQQSALFQQANDQTDAADALARATEKFRISAIYISDSGAGNERSAQARNDLTDASIAIANNFNLLGAAGNPVYELLRNDPVLTQFDNHVDDILALSARAGAPEYAAAVRRIAVTNARLGEITHTIAEGVARQRRDSFAALGEVSRKWEASVAVAGMVTLLMVLLLLLDVTRNIMPPLRQMHRALRRLAAGDLDVVIEPSPLHELNQLSQALETFRSHARAISELANVDAATSLPNRRAFIAGAEAALAARGGDTVAVMLLDIDRFKCVNDDFGHEIGDRLIAAIGSRLIAMLPQPSIVARLGGDEFAILVRLPAGDTKAARLAGNVAAQMRESFDLGDCRIAITVSLGYTVIAGESAKAGVIALLSQADLAVYAAKAAGRNQAKRFIAKLAELRDVERSLERDLAEALAGDQLRMVYQPIHAIDDDAGREIEALVRWVHPRNGEIPPARFIPAAERTGQMLVLGQWIIDRALSDLQRWPDISMSINLSPLQLQADGFVGQLVESCRRASILPQRLILEVTETLALEKNSRAFITLELLRQFGFRIALDDFGTGYSSLWLLKAFRFDRLKLDGSLISDLASDTKCHAVFDAAVAMGLRLGAEVVAEGVGDALLVDPLTLSGCTHLQGYHFSRPIEAADVAGYFERPDARVRLVA